MVAAALAGQASRMPSSQPALNSASIGRASQVATPSFEPQLAQLRREAAEAMATLLALETGRPIGLREGGGPRFPTTSEIEAATATVRNVLDATDCALRPAGNEFVIALIGILSTGFPAARLAEREAEIRVDLYVAVLADIPADLLAAGARQALKACRFFPTIAELLEGIEDQLAERIANRNRLARLIDAPRLPSPRGDNPQPAIP